MSSPLSSPKKKIIETANKSKTISRIIEGTIGESEFYCQRLYSCAARASKDCTIFEIDYNSFIELLKEFGKEAEYNDMFQNEKDILMKASTSTILNKFNCNIKNSKMSKMMKSGDAALKKQFIILPGSLVHNILELSSHLITIAMCLTVPYYIAFSNVHISKMVSLVDNPIIMFIDSFATIYYFIVILLSFRYIAIESEDRLVTDPSRIATIYYNTSFSIDLVCVIPMALLIYASTQDQVLYLWFRLQYMILLYKAKGMFHYIFSIFEWCGIRLNSTYQKVIGIIAIIWYISHITTCFLCYLGLDDSLYSWIQKNEFDGKTNIHIYLRGFFWSIYTMTTVGYGSIGLANNQERILAMLVMVCGAILGDAGLTSVVGNIISDKNKMQSELRRYLESTLLFCRSNDIHAGIIIISSSSSLSSSLSTIIIIIITIIIIIGTQNQIASFYNYLQADLKGHQEIDDFNLLSPALRKKLVLTLGIIIIITIIITIIIKGMFGLQSNYISAMTITPCDVLKIPVSAFKEVKDDNIEMMSTEEKAEYLKQIPFFKKWSLYDLHEVAAVILLLLTITTTTITIISTTSTNTTTTTTIIIIIIIIIR